jgi:hypothetical protein
MLEALATGFHMMKMKSKLENKFNETNKAVGHSFGMCNGFFCMFKNKP